jgi:hypothetical protein
MDPKLVYWTAALLNMAIVVALALRGVVRIRRGDVRRHRRAMLAAASLVLAFVASYLLKVLWLGRENLVLWSPTAVWTLRFHEACVFAMLVAAAWAARHAWRIRRTRRVTGQATDPPADPRNLRAHRLAGRAALISAILGLCSACVVLAGMYARSPA